MSDRWHKVWTDLVTLQWLTSADGRPSYSRMVEIVLIVWIVRYIQPQLSLLFLALVVILATLTYGWKGIRLISSWVLARINAPKGDG
ncbi:MAG: hypothetical protein ACYC3L_01060 [Gemmatimonadaceae bacterium]